MILHNFFRSSASWRVRIALNLKGLDFEYESVHLRRNGGEQFSPAYRVLNPQALVPVLAVGGLHLTQSLAIVEYLDETHPDPPLLPKDPAGRARVRALAMDIACDLHPLNNLRVLKYLAEHLGASDEAKSEWYRHWVALGLQGLEATLARDPRSGRFCHGDAPSLADCCLVPQLFQARRFGCDVSSYSTLLAIEERCNALPAFQKAAPGVQPDAQE